MRQSQATEAGINVTKTERKRKRERKATLMTDGEEEREDKVKGIKLLLTHLPVRPNEPCDQRAH